MKTIILLIAAFFVIGCGGDPVSFLEKIQILDSVSISFIFSPTDDTPDSLIHNTKWRNSSAADTYFVYTSWPNGGFIRDTTVTCKFQIGDALFLLYNKSLYIRNGVVTHPQWIYWGECSVIDGRPSM